MYLIIYQKKDKCSRVADVFGVYRPARKCSFFMHCNSIKTAQPCMKNTTEFKEISTELEKCTVSDSCYR